MFDITAAEKLAKKEIADELEKKAAGKIKAKLKEIAMAKQVVLNLENEYKLLIAEIGSDVG